MRLIDRCNFGAKGRWHKVNRAKCVVGTTRAGIGSRGISSKPLFGERYLCKIAKSIKVDLVSGQALLIVSSKAGIITFL